MSTDKSSHNLLDEKSLERQAPVVVKKKKDHDGEADDGDSSEWSSVASVQKWEITPCSGDVVTVAGYDGFQGLVVRGADEDAIDTDGSDESSATPDHTVEVWFCAPAFTGDRQTLFVTCPPEDVTVVDRPFDINMLVWQDNGEPGGREGMIIHTYCTVTGHRLHDIIEYLVSHQKVSTKPFTATSAKLEAVSGKGRHFICSNPFRLGNFVYSKRPGIPIPVGGEISPPEELIQQQQQQLFYGHVTSTVFNLLVQVLLPRKGSHSKFIFVCNDISSNDDVEVDSLDNIPPQLDIAHCTQKFLVRDHTFFSNVIWISGDFESLAAQLDDRNGPISCLVLFAFVDRVVAEDFLTGELQEHRASDIISAEPYLNSCVMGMTGFLLPEDHPLFCGREDGENEPPNDALPTSKIDVPTFSSVVDWLEESGVVGSPVSPDWSYDQWVAYWQLRVHRLTTCLPNFIVITGTQSTCDVVFRETGFVERSIRSATLAPIESDWNNDHDIFPFHVVAPSDTYKAFVGDAELDGRADDQCSLYDCWPVYKYGTEMEVGEAVRPRVEKEHFVIRGQDLPDPTYLGFVHRVDKANQLCAVTWHKQCDDPFELMRRRPNDVGQILELMRDTRLRVQWQDGAVEVLCRSEVVPCRRDVGESEDDFGDEEDELDESELMGMNAEQIAMHIGFTNGQTMGSADSPARASSWWGWVPSSISRAVTRVIGSVRDALERGRQSFYEDTHADPLTAEPPQPLEHTQSSDANSGISEEEEEASPESSAPVAAQVPPVSPVESAAASSPRTLGEFSSCSTFTSHLLWDRMDAAAFAPVNSQIFTRRVAREVQTLRQYCETPAGEAAGATSTMPTLLIKSSEDELRLIKFVMLGPMHTPYYQSFLAFDVACPEQFPISPPSVKFHAYGLRLNPNLYEDGYICLSLLGTWEGHAECERWSPAKSNILQVVLSLQSLVLVKEPYYNEANFEQYRGQESARVASKAYSESVALLRIQHLIAMMEAPPPDWRYEFRQYCKSVLPKLMTRLGELIEDQAAGKLAQCEPGSITADGLVLPLTAGFAVALSRSLQVLRATFAAKSAIWAAEEASYALPE